MACSQTWLPPVRAPYREKSGKPRAASEVIINNGISSTPKVGAMWLQLHAVCFGTRTLCRGPCRFQVRCDPFPACPPVPHDVKAVEQAVPLAVFSKAGHRRPHGREF